MKELKINGKAAIKREESDACIGSSEREQARPAIRGKAIYTTKGAAREYGRIGCNFYKGCPHGCEYCYLKRGAPSAQLGGNVAVLKKCFKDEEDAGNVFCKEIDKWLEPCKKYGIFLSFSTDPLIPETRSLTLKAIIEAVLRDIPVYILTKDATFVNDECEFMAWMENVTLPYRDLIHFGFTLTGRDNMEPNASPNMDRIKAMEQLHGMGFKTFASIEPVIDWMHASMVIHLTLGCCDHYKIGLRSGVKKDYYDEDLSRGSIRGLVDMITHAGRTVYLKESTRKLLRRCFIEEECEHILSMTVDMDGKPYKRLPEC